MIKSILSVTLVFGLWTTAALQADHIPVPPKGVLEFQGRTAALFKIGAVQPFVELRGKIEDAAHELRYHGLTLGSYFRILDNLKLGAFYRLQAGERHDDDWIFTDPGWKWSDTRSRYEHLLMLDASPRFLLDFLPGKNWVFMLKTRYMFNITNSQHSILLRPGLTYFLLLDREPVFNFAFNYYMYFSLNFGNTAVYKHWPQLNVLYHVSPLLKLELSGAYKTVFWSTSKDVEEIEGDDYTEAFRSFVLGFGILFNIDL